MGGYVADDWQVSDRLTFSLNLRLENYANPSCDSNCFSRLTTSFAGIPNPAAVSTPYNQMIISGQHNAYPNPNCHLGTSRRHCVASPPQRQYCDPSGRGHICRR